MPISADEIRKIVIEATQRQVRAQQLPQAVPYKERPSFLRTFLYSITLVMSVITCVLIYNHIQQENRVPVGTKKATITIKSDGGSTAKPPVGDWKIELEQRVSKLESEQALSRDRTWLLGLAVTENANLNKKVDHTYHRNADNGYIVFDKDWNINKMPQTLQLDEKQKEAIKKHVKKSASIDKAE